ncbi:MAG TPA: methyltransferase [Candidatus Binataceae bacterium]|nr:methyltransferase [Candidatus Binataceae bacterium]
MDFSRLADLAGAHAGARAIQVALKLGMFQALAGRPLGANELAAAIQCDARATGLLANALAALGLLEKQAHELSLTGAARRFLLAGSSEFLGGMILFDEAMFPLWARLEDSIRSGRPARTPDMFQHRPDETARFIRAMDSLVRARGDAVWTAEHLDLPETGAIADVGGGPGTYLIEFMRRHPSLKGAILDLPATLAVAREVLNERDPGLAARIELTEYDYRRQEMAAGFDAIFLSNIIHSEDAETNRALLGRCYRGLRPGGIVIVKDHVMNADLTEPAGGAVFSLYLLLTTPGRDYSLDEVTGWLRDAGFSSVDCRALPSPPFSSSIVTARKA